MLVAVESDRGGQVSLKLIMLHIVEKKLKIKLGQSACLIGLQAYLLVKGPRNANSSFCPDSWGKVHSISYMYNWICLWASC